jgi:hypothetical protein
MEIVIFFKPKEARTPEIRYRMDLEQFNHLSSDYESYLKTGYPKEGLYRCQTAKVDPSLATPKMVRLKFDEISAIG